MLTSSALMKKRYNGGSEEEHKQKYKDNLSEFEAKMAEIKV